MGDISEEVLRSMAAGRKVPGRDLARLQAEIEAKKAHLEDLRREVEEGAALDASVAYLLTKRSLERSERVMRIHKREKFKQAEGAWHRGAHGMGKDEAEYFAGYSSMMDEYAGGFPSLDFKNRQVPIEYYVHVHALGFCGVLEIGDKFIEVKENSLYFVRKKDVLHLLESGRMRLV